MATTFRSDGVTARAKDPMYHGGKKFLSVDFRKALTSGTNAAGDIFILSGPHTFDSRIAKVLGIVPAMAGATSIDLGFYQKNADGTFTPVLAAGGAELVSANDLHLGQAYNDLLELNTALDRTKGIGTILGLTSESELPNGTYLGLRSNAQITQATATLALTVQVEEATR